MTYADSSFLVSLYGQDDNSRIARSAASSQSSAFVFTPLHDLEMRNAFRLAVFRKEITQHQCDAVLASIDDDLKAGVLNPTPVAWAEVFRLAEGLGDAHTRQLGIRSIDILHVSTAISLGASTFLSFDARQLALAKKARLKVGP